MRIVITGKDGQLGWELRRAFPAGEILAFGRSDLDLADPNAIRRRMRDICPDVIVNAAAHTSVDKAESECELAMAVNGVAPGILAEEAGRLGALLVHYSTDYVFDGTKSSAYAEGDEPNPLNVYGATKLAGERAIQAAGSAHLILRTSWVYGLRGRNFLLTVLRLAREQEELNVVDDQIGSPTWCRCIAQATARILKTCSEASSSRFNRYPSGIFHLTASGKTSWFGFAKDIIARTANVRKRSPQVKPIASDRYPTPARRPKNSVLCNAKFERVFGFTLEPWQQELQRVLAEYVEQGTNAGSS